MYLEGLAVLAALALHVFQLRLQVPALDLQGCLVLRPMCLVSTSFVCLTGQGGQHSARCVIGLVVSAAACTPEPIRCCSGDVAVQRCQSTSTVLVHLASGLQAPCMRHLHPMSDLHRPAGSASPHCI